MEILISILTIFLTLFAVIDMIGNVPLIIKLRKEYGEVESLKSTIISTLIMILFLFTGSSLFKLIGIEMYHFALAGSFLILYFGIKMVLGVEDKKTKKQSMNATVFPIAFPLISGPGTLSTIISLKSEFSSIEIIIGILLNSILIYLILKSADWIKDKVGLVGITLMERVFGIILIAIGMKILINNLVLSIKSIL